MTRLFTITTTPEELEHLSRVKPVPDYEKHYQAGIGNSVLVCCPVEGRMQWISAVWGIKQGQLNPGSISMSKILVRKPFNIWFRKYRCAIPVNCFYFQKDQDVYLTRVLKQRTFMLGGICIPPDSGNPNYRFAILELEAADILKRITDTMPVNFNSHSATSWCTEKTILNVMQMADSSGDRWFDFYKVDPEILIPGRNNKAFLRPVDISYREWIEREEKLNARDFTGDRYNRNNSKGRH